MWKTVAAWVSLVAATIVLLGAFGIIGGAPAWLLPLAVVLIGLILVVPSRS